MIGKKINQLATELAPDSTDLTIIGDPISGVSKKITLAQLGAIFSGAVSFYTNLAAFPVTGDINVIYCAKDTQKLYLWSGSAYVEVFPSQALLNTYQLRSEKGVSNGYASLDSAGKVPIAQLPSSIMEYKGTWNASTNTPTLANGTGDTGDVYICNVAGTVNFGAGPLTFAVGDYVIYSGTIWQRSSGAVGTVTSVAASITGNSIGITGSPITTSGTLALAFAGTSSQYINGAGNLTTFPTLTGYVPYTGATANVDLGTYDLTADFITASRGSYTSSGGGNTLEISHTSGSGIALNITKGGSGEGLYINKTSGSGNAATIVGTLEATTLVKTGGTSSQFLKADGSVDSSTYVTTDTFQNISASKTFAVGFNIASAGGTNQITSFINTSSLFSGSAGSNVFGFNSANNIYFGKGLDNGGVLQWNNAAVRYYTLPDATGTIALVGGAGVGTVTSVGLSSSTSGVTIGSSPITTSGTITLAIATASGLQQGLLSSSDWTTFNNKQSALTNPVTGTGTTNYLPKFTGTSTIGNSAIFENGTNVGINTASPSSYTNLTTLTINGTNGSVIDLKTGNTLYGEIYSLTNELRIDAVGASSVLKFLTNSATRMTLDASGNLGLGVTPSAWNTSAKALQINGGSMYASNTYNFIGSNSVWENTGDKYINNGFATIYGQINGEHRFYNAPSGTAGNAISFTQAMTLDASGNLGVGATSVNSRLQVTAAAGLSHARWTESATTIGFVGGAQGIITGHNGKFAVRGESGLVLSGQGNSADMIIASTGAATFSSSVTAGGLVTINKTNEGLILTAGANTDASYMSTRANNGTGWLIMGSQGSVGNYIQSGTGANESAITTVGAYALALGTNQSERMRITSGGNVGIGTTSPASVLEVAGTSATTDFRISRTVSASTYFYISAPGGTPSTATLGVNGTAVMQLKSSQVINFVNVPSSSAGLSSGDIYKSAGVLMIV